MLGASPSAVPRFQTWPQEQHKKLPPMRKGCASAGQLALELWGQALLSFAGVP